MGQGLSGSSKPIIASTGLQQETIADSCSSNIQTIRDIITLQDIFLFEKTGITESGRIQGAFARPESGPRFATG
jgi:hypothetical protein